MVNFMVVRSFHIVEEQLLFKRIIKYDQQTFEFTKLGM